MNLTLLLLFTILVSSAFSLNNAVKKCSKTNDSSSFSCKEEGNFDDISDISCAKYFKCSRFWFFFFNTEHKSCPDETFFNPIAGKCEENYECTCKNKVLQDTSQNVNCVKSGRLDNEEDKTCSTYFICTESSPAVFISSTFKCPNQTLFNPVKSKCSKNYVCPRFLKLSGNTTELLLRPINNVSCTEPDQRVIFNCSNLGSFSDPNDPFCSNYILCQYSRNGFIQKSVLKCPPGSLWNPENHTCSVDYICACTKTLAANHIEDYIEEKMAASTIKATNPEITIRSLNISSCVLSESHINFQCSQKGRFPNPNDLYCTTYLLCNLLNNGTFIKTPYTCPKGSYFDPGLHICSIYYSCPCTETTTTSSLPYSTASSTAETTELTTIILSTTALPCVILENRTEFECLQKGRFANPNDPYCTTYFLCSLLTSGAFIKTLYTCSMGSYFDPSLHICSIYYICACTQPTTKTSTLPSSTTPTIIETTTSEITTHPNNISTAGSTCIIPENTIDFECLQKGRFANPNDPYCTTYFLCSLLLNGTFIKTPYTCPAGSYFGPSLHICSIYYKCACTQLTTKTATQPPSTTPSAIETPTSEITTHPINISTTESTCVIPENTIDFECLQKGRFANANDPYCTTYFLCSLLMNGTFIKTRYTCPAGSYFDPSLHICSIYYICACTQPTTKTSTLPSSTTPTAIETTTSEITTHPNNISTTGSTCVIPENTIDFVCLQKGRFANPNDPYCTTYFLCSLLLNGTFIKTRYTCPAGSCFDPSQHICSIYYTCACTQPTTKTSTLPPFTTPSAIETTTSEITTHPNNISTTGSTCVIPDNTSDLVCSQKGRFANPNDPSCTTYFLCSLLLNGTFIKTPYTCPARSYFDPSLHICSIYYICACTQLTTKTSTLPPFTTPSAIETTTSEVTTHPNNISTTGSTCIIPENTIDFVCLQKGRFANPNDPYCTTYFLCSLLLNGTFIKTPYTCPAGSYFDPSLHICSIYYTCACTQPTTKTSTLSPFTTPSAIETTTEITTHPNNISTTGSTCVIPDNTSDFVCSQKGRFANPNEPYCTTYFLCSLLLNGTFIKTPYTCPAGSYFDPSLHICSIYYTCACTQLTTKTSTQPPSTTPSAIETTTAEVTTHPNNISTTGSTCIIPENTIDFVCLQKGRFANANDPYCTTYFLCSLLMTGTFIKTRYTCPAGSYFDPSLHICSIYYICACTQPTTKTSTLPSSRTPTAIETTTSDITTHPNNISTTGSTCVIPENTIDFVCLQKGRFANPNDPYCTTYFLCSLLLNGTFIKTPYTCPAGSYFDPSQHICSIYYTCACTQPTTKTSTLPPFTTPSAIETTTSEITTHPNNISTTGSTCVIPDNTSDFVCSQKGRFANPNDPYCTTYFLCSLLLNGTFIKTPYTCPAGSYFDPSLLICSIYYKCACTQPITKTSTQPPSTTPSAIETTTSEITTHPNNISTTGSTCVIPENIIDFVCLQKGRFSNPNDPYCTTYFLCSLLLNGTFIKTPYTCPAGSYFDPSLHICSIYYTCACTQLTTKTSTLPSSTTPTVIETTTSEIATHPNNISTTGSTCVIPENTLDFECLQKGRFANPNDPYCTTYFLCSLLLNGTFIKTPYTCPAGSYFDPSLHICSIYYTCACTQFNTKTSTQPPSTTPRAIETTTLEITTHPNNISTTGSTCIIPENTIDFECLQKGRFANPNDPYCTTYFLCNLLRNGTLLQTSYSCPNNSYFDSNLHICSIYYTCACIKQVTKTSLTPRTTSSIAHTMTPDIIKSFNNLSTTDLPCTTKGKIIFKCLQIGRFPDLSNAYCTTYFLCNQLENGTMLKTVYSCPKGSYFDPNLRKCSIDYTCPCTKTTINTLTSTSKTITTIAPEIATSNLSTTSLPCIVPEKKINFDCSEKGRFADPNNAYCTIYFLCNQLENGTMLKTAYSCPKDSYFDPNLHKCSIDYICPCTKTTLNTLTTTAKTITTTASEIATSNVSTTSLPCVFPEKKINFDCSEKGRFADPNNAYCTIYFLCNQLVNGTMLKTAYSCPKGSYFDPNLHKCSIDYICPCTKTTLNTLTTTAKTITTTAPEIATSNVSTTSLPCVFPEKKINFDCSEKGRFADPNNAYCTIYFLCNQLVNGTMLKTAYSCPKGSYFDPNLHKCSIDYICPCTKTTLNTLTTTVKTITTTAPEIATSNVSTTSLPCVFPEKKINFDCLEKGRFADPNNAYCTIYFLCNQLVNGTMLKTAYSCPKGSYFNPNLHKCSIDYICPCTKTTLNTLTTTVKTITTTAPEIATSNVSTTSLPCVFPEKKINFDCLEKGRFADPNNAYCTIYFLCNQLENGTMLKTAYSCPKGSYFDPNLHKCSIDYICPCTKTTLNTLTTTAKTITTTAPEIVTSNVSTTSLPCVFPEKMINFDCSEKGRFADPNNAYCTIYFLCNQLENGTMLKTAYSCPKGSYFNPNLHKCSIDYICPCTKTTLNTLTTTVKTITTTAPEIATSNVSTTSLPCVFSEKKINFDCSEKGRFADPNNAYCTIYFLCNQLVNGTMLKTAYSCPKGSYFDPNLHKCSIDYICPCTKTTLTTLTTTAKTITATAPEIATSNVSTTSLPCVFPGKKINFDCLEKGRFADPNNAYCTIYFLCNQLENGTMLKTAYSCPKGSYFDPNLHKCSIDYICPCTKTTLNTLTTTAKTITTTAPEIVTSNVSTTSLPCVFPEQKINFDCSEKGRFADPNNAYCTIYFLCNQLENGTMLKTAYSCPKGSYFNPNLHKCSIDYICPCTKTTLNTLTTTVKTITTTAPEIATSNVSTTSLPCVFSEKKINFDCSEKGRFADPNNAYCTIYFLCNQLVNGTMLKTAYSCPKGSYFDPNLHKCSIDYICPCTKTTLTTLTTTAKTITATAPEIATSNVSTTSLPCVFPGKKINFDCLEKGRFADPNNAYCTIYFLCNQLVNGTMLKTAYSCPKGSYFDPNLHKCSIDYICPCTKTTLNTLTTTAKTITTTAPEIVTSNVSTTSLPCVFPEKMINFDCSEKGRFADPNNAYCTIYFLCNQLVNGTMLKTAYSCPKGSYFDPNLHKCSIDYICPCTKTTLNTLTTTVKTITTTAPEIATSNVSTTSLPCVFPEQKINFDCSEKGRFADPNNAYCTIYFLCNQLENGTMLKTAYSCPKGSYFNPNLHKCSIDYICPCTKTTLNTLTTTVKTITTTAPEIATSNVSTTSLPCVFSEKKINFDCSEKGRFADPNNAYCTIYFLCNQLVNGTMLKTAYSCPKGSYFDPNLHKCSIDYICPCTKTTLTTLTTTAKTITATAPEIATSNVSTTSLPCVFPGKKINFDCLEKGRFADPNNAYCTIYFLCNQLENGTMLKTAYSCPKGSYFDPNLHKCSIDYICPCTKTTLNTLTTTTRTITTTAPEIAASNVSTTSLPCVFPEKKINFDCSEKGRFADPNNAYCTIYFLCNQLENGTMLKTAYSCPKGSYFDPNLHKCSIDYICPCTKTTLNTLTTTTRTITTTAPEIAASNVSTTSLPCVFPEKKINFDCSEKGRFADPNNAYCTIYFLCNQLENGTMLKTAYSCPKGSYFDPNLHKCNIDYICPCTKTTLNTLTTTTRTITTTAPEIAASNVSTTSLPCVFPEKKINFDCSEKGRFADPNNAYCTIYFLCNQLENGTMLKTGYSCPKGSYFDPNLHKCSIDYICPCTKTTLNTLTTTTRTITTTGPEIAASNVSTTSLPCVFPEKKINFDCSEKGRFADPNNAYCTIYFLCNQLENGTMLKTAYSCPKGSYFDPNLHKCSIDYICPCTKTTLNTAKTITTTAPEIVTSNVSTSSLPCVVPENKIQFECSQKGRFSDPNNPYCTTYFLCNLSNGVMKKTAYSCPVGMYFDPNDQKCSLNYHCSCIKKND